MEAVLIILTGNVFLEVRNKKTIDNISLPVMDFNWVGDCTEG
jgi:hypothetical protein